jgi:hypothetical protein
MPPCRPISVGLIPRPDKPHQVGSLVNVDDRLLKLLMIRLLCCVLLFVAGGCSHKPVAQLVDEGEGTTGRKAIRLYNQALANEPTNVRALWRRGNEYAQTDQPEKALADFTQAIAWEPTYNTGYLFGDRGEVLKATKLLPEAIRDYTTALAVCRRTLSPSLPSTPMEDFYFYPGRAQLKAGDTTAARGHRWRHLRLPQVSESPFPTCPFGGHTRRLRPSPCGTRSGSVGSERRRIFRLRRRLLLLGVIEVQPTGCQLLYFLGCCTP